MKLSQKELKEMLKKAKPFFTKAQLFITTNIRYIIVAILFIFLVILLVKCTSDDKKESGAEEAQILRETGEEVEDITISEESGEGEEAVEEIIEVPNDLQTDMYPEVNAVVNSYYTAISSSDTATLSGIIKGLSEDEINQLVQRREYIENFQNIVCYTKNGPVENSYVVFAYHETKFININTLAPGLQSLYVYTDETGNTYISYEDLDEEAEAYIESVVAHEDVVTLYNTVDTKFQEAQTADGDLKAFVEQLNSVASTTEQTEETAIPEETAPADGANEETTQTE